MKKGILILGSTGEGARLQQQLEELGYAVDYLISESDEAIAKVEQSAPNLVLVDLRSRRPLGWLHIASRIASRLEVPWICFAPSQESPSIKAARRLGSHGYISGDLNRDALLASIKKALHKPQREKAPTHNFGWFVKTIKNLSDAVFITDPEGRIVFMNMQAEAITGISDEECRRLPLDRVINIRRSIEDGTHQEVIQEAISKRISVTSDGQFYSLFTSEGKEILREFTLSPIKDSSSKLVAFLLLVKVGWGHEIGDAIVRAKREWEQSMDSVPELVAVVSRDKKIVRLNKAMAQALGSAPRDAIGGSCCSLFGEGQNHPCLHDNTMRDGKVRSQEVIPQKLNAEYQLTVAPYSDSSGKIVGTVHIATNVAEIRRSQDALRVSRDSLLKKCEQLEASLLGKRRQLSESHGSRDYFSDHLVSHMEAFRALVLSSEQKRRDAEEDILTKLENSVKPLIMQLRAQRLPEISQSVVKALEYHVSQICTQPDSDLGKLQELLTFRENQICDMIRSGLSSKEIAEVLGVSDHTILCHRVRIRKKLGLSSGKQQLAEYLRSTKIASDEMA